MNKAVRYILNYIDIICFIVFVTIKVLLYGKQISPGYFSYLSLLPSVLASIMILTAVSSLFSCKKRARFLFICNLVISIFIISDINYFRYFKDIISIPVVINALMLGAVGASVKNIFKVTDLLFIIDLILIIPIINHYKYKHKAEIPGKLKLAVFIAVFCAAGFVNINSFYRLSKEQPRLLTTMYNRIYIANALGSINYHCLDIYNLAVNTISRETPVSKSKEQEIQTFLETNTASSNNLKNEAKGKNLIIIQVEALQQFAIGSRIEGAEITPNLNKWINKSVYFDNYFYQIASGGTSDAEFMTNNSLYPAASGAAYFLYCGNEFSALPKELKDQGYTTAAMHGYKESFWNRNVMYKKLEFENFFSEKSYNINENVGLGLSDKSFLTQSVNKIKNLKQPYYSFLITLSSHFPYDDVKHYGNFNVGQFDGTLMGNYLKAIHYTDEQLGMFLNELDKEGITKNSIIVLYGDHYAIPKNQENLLAKFKNVSSLSDLQWAELQKVPLIIHFPGDAHKGVNSIYSGQMDLYPTLANLFGLPSSSLLGKDMFNSTGGKVIFRDGSFTDGKSFYVSANNTYYDISSGNTISENNDLKNKKQNALNQLEYSDDILKHNLLKKFNNVK